MWTLMIFACFLPSQYLQFIAAKKLTDTYSLNLLQSSPEESENVTDPVTTPPVMCPPDKSLHTKEDIWTMIDYLVNTLSIYQSIHNSYYPQAIEVRNKHMEDLNNFLVWFQDRPEHLKHILEDFNFLKHHIEPSVRNIARVLEEYPRLEENFDKQSKKTNKLSKNLNRYRIICENNCQIQNFMTISNEIPNDTYYCSSLEDLHINIKSKLSIFAKQLISAIRNHITYDDYSYSKEIDVLKNDLKDVALKEFGRTMYDILTLSDEYHHFIEDVIRIDSKSEVYNIKEMSLLIDTKLLELDQLVEKYGTYCRTCNNNVPRIVSQNYNKENVEVMQIKSNNIVDQLLTIKYAEIETAIHKDYMTIFEDLNLLLNNTDSMKVYSTDLKPIQDEVIEMLKKERAEFDELKGIAPQELINNLLQLATESQRLLSEINEKIDNLTK